MSGVSSFCEHGLVDVDDRELFHYGILNLCSTGISLIYIPDHVGVMREFVCADFLPLYSKLLIHSAYRHRTNLPVREYSLEQFSTVS
jgi:hypothetical protein